MEFSIRDVKDEDLDAVLNLNEAVVPAVNSVSLDRMRWFSQIASYFRIVSDENDELAAFLVGFRPGTDYDSPNYRWFCAQYDDFAYVDRVAVSDHARRHGLATRLYDDFRSAMPKSVTVMTCEVNLRPPNASSMRFHELYGFEQVGSQLIDGGNKEVALLARPLNR